MKLSDLSQITTPVVIERGPFKLTLDCYLEKISTENDEYAALQRAEDTARQADTSALIAQQGVVDAGYVYSQLFPEGNPLPPKQMEAKRKEIETSVTRMAEERKATEAVVIRNQAERIAYLVKSWDLTEDDGETPVPVSVDVMLKSFSLPLLQLILKTIEDTVFGPLA